MPDNPHLSKFTFDTFADLRQAFVNILAKEAEKHASHYQDPNASKKVKKPKTPTIKPRAEYSMVDTIDAISESDFCPLSVGSGPSVSEVTFGAPEISFAETLADRSLSRYVTGVYTAPLFDASKIPEVPMSEARTFDASFSVPFITSPKAKKTADSRPVAWKVTHEICKFIKESPEKLLDATGLMDALEKYMQTEWNGHALELSVVDIEGMAKGLVRDASAVYSLQQLMGQDGTHVRAMEGVALHPQTVIDFYTEFMSKTSLPDRSIISDYARPLRDHALGQATKHWEKMSPHMQECLKQFTIPEDVGPLVKDQLTQIYNTSEGLLTQERREIPFKIPKESNLSELVSPIENAVRNRLESFTHANGWQKAGQLVSVVAGIGAFGDGIKRIRNAFELDDDKQMHRNWAQTGIGAAEVGLGVVIARVGTRGLSPLKNLSRAQREELMRTPDMFHDHLGRG